MEFTKNKQGVSQDYQEKMNTLFRMDNHLEVVGKEVPSMINLNERDNEKGKYGVIVESVDLVINHTEILENGMKYLIDEGVSLQDPLDYWNEYSTWVDNFNSQVESKGKIQESSEKLSPSIQKQFQKEWMSHLESKVYPNRKPKSSGLDIKEFFGPITSSVEPN